MLVIQDDDCDELAAALQFWVLADHSLLIKFRPAFNLQAATSQA